MNIVNATTFRRHLFGYLSAAANDEKIVVATKHGNVAIVSERYLRSLEDTCLLASVPGMAESIIEGLASPIDECVKVDWENDLN